MSSKIWSDFTKIEELKSKNNNLNIKSYLSRKDFIVEEIIEKDQEKYDKINEIIESLKIIEKMKIYAHYKEDQKIFVIIDNNEKIQEDFESSLSFNNNNNIDIKEEGILRDHCGPISKKEIENLLKLESSLCKINCQIMENNAFKDIFGTGFFCEIKDKESPIKYALFTCNHVLNGSNIKIGKSITIEKLKKNKYQSKTINITDQRKVITSKKFDYTCVGIVKEDHITHFFEIDDKIFDEKKVCYKNEDIFILQYPKGGNFSFSDGKIININDCIRHTASTQEGSSGSPIIRRSSTGIEKNVIGLHCKTNINRNNKDYSNYNIGYSFDLILYDIKFKFKWLTKFEKYNYNLFFQMIGNNIFEIFNNLNEINVNNDKNNYIKNYSINNKNITFNLTIMNGQDKFKITPINYIKKCDFCFFVYETSNKESFNKIGIIIPEIDGKPFILVGLKKATREVSFKEGEKLAHDNQSFFFELDIISHETINDIYLKVIDKLFD